MKSFFFMSGRCVFCSVQVVGCTFLSSNLIATLPTNIDIERMLSTHFSLFLVLLVINYVMKSTSLVQSCPNWTKLTCHFDGNKLRDKN